MRVRAIALSLCLTLTLSAQVRQFKPGFNLFSPQQDVQMGKEAATEVEKTMQVVDNPELTNYLNTIVQRLAKAPQAGSFPYTVKVVNDKSINAFALPGGPMFVHTGLIAAAENESQMAGVLAHEMSHVALRHGTNQASKANLIQLPAMLATGILGQGSIWSQLGQLGIGLGAQSVLLKYSRDAETQADLNGAQMLNAVGYDPVAMAEFFEKLKSEGGQGEGFLANFLSDHPSPGNRVQYVSEQNKYLPQVPRITVNAADLDRARKIVASLPPPAPPKTAVANAAGVAAAPEQGRPSGKYKSYSGKSFALRFPDNWEAFGEQESSMVTIAPRAALLQDAKGQTQIGYGLMASYYIPSNNYIDLNRETSTLVQQLQQTNPSLVRSRGGSQRYIQVAGQRALVTPLQSPSPYPNQIEADTLVTLVRPEGLFYMLFITPQSETSGFTKDFNNILGSLKFSSTK